MMNRFSVHRSIFKICSGVGDKNARTFRDDLFPMIYRQKKLSGMIILDSVVSWSIMINCSVIGNTAPATEIMFCKKIHSSLWIEFSCLNQMLYLVR